LADQVHTRAFGSGKPIWLFHSLLADAGSCIPLAQQLSAEHRAFVPDLPGFGGSAPAGPGLDAVADRMAAAMAETPAVVFGNGYGSFVALVLALRHPALVRSLVLAGTGAAFSEPGRVAFRAMAQAASAKGLGAVADVAMRRLFAPEFQAANPALLAERRARFLATDLAVFTDACAALAALDLRDAVRSLAIPALVIVGAQDEATPPAMARELVSLLPEARLVELEGCAHVPQLQAPDRVIEAMRGFV
jgi:3-oxoadipate enol-lactonase